MKFYQKLDGASHVSAREYDIAANTAITEGQLVKLTDGLVVAAAVAQMQSRSARSTGGGTALGATLTPAQKYVLDAWNTEHPEMAMTAREFLGR